MYTPTHGLGGFTFAALYMMLPGRKKFTTGEFVAVQGLCAFASMLPDLPLLIGMLLNYLSGCGNFFCVYNVRLTAALKILHGLPIWLIPLSVILYLQYCKLGLHRERRIRVALKKFLLERNGFWFKLEFFFWGTLSHVIVDSMTHGRGPEGHSYIWPLELLFPDRKPRLGWLWGIWNYRPETGYWPKGAELALCYFLGVSLAALWCRHLYLKPCVIRLRMRATHTKTVTSSD